MIPLLALSGDPEAAAYKMGQMVGMALPIVLAAVGALWCLVRLSRPEVNRKGLASLCVVFTGWGLAMIIVMAKKAIGAGIVYDFATAGVVGVSAITAVILAVAALLEPGPPRSGRGHAIAALVLSGLIGFLFMIGFTMGLVKGMERSRLADTGKNAIPQPIRFDAEGFVLKNLPIPWVRTNEKKLNRLACLGLIRAQPEGYVIVIVEKLNPGSRIALENFVAVVKSNLLNASPTAKVLSEGPETLNGTEGIRMVCSAQVKNIDVVYRYWLHTGQDHAYQVIGWTVGHDGEKAVRLLDPVFSNLELLPHP